MTVTTAEDPWPAIARGCGLLEQLGLGEGDRLVVLLGSDLAAFGLLAAACLEGVVAVPLPPDLAGSDARELLTDADPQAVVLDPRVTRAHRAVTDHLGRARAGRVRTATHEQLTTTRRREPSGRWPRTRPMAYTSGTTGRRKGVHAGVHDPGWGEQLVADELAAFDHRHGDVHLTISPIYHSGPFRHALVTALTGGRLAMLPAFDAGALLAALREVRPSSLFAVPTHLHRLLAHPATTADDLGSLTLLAHAGAPCPVPLKHRLLELAPAGSVWEFYGATEGQFTVASPQRWLAAPGTVGVARPDRTVEVRGPDGRLLPPGQVGTVWAHVPAHARFRYWRDPDRTAAAWDGDAFTVGDLGRLDADGQLTLEGRPGDLVITGGVNVYPAEVERALLALPGVAEAVVFGVPDADWGERLEAAVVAWPDQHLDGPALRETLRGRLTRAALPKRIRVVDELPRTATGKVRRTGLAEALGEPGARSAS